MTVALTMFPMMYSYRVFITSAEVDENPVRDEASLSGSSGSSPGLSLLNCEENDGNNSEDSAIGLSSVSDDMSLDDKVITIHQKEMNINMIHNNRSSKMCEIKIFPPYL